LFLRNPIIRKSATPLAAAALYLPGLAFTWSKYSRNVLSFIDAGTESDRASELTLAIGMRSRSAL
jgi:hypothetical protein